MNVVDDIWIHHVHSHVFREQPFNTGRREGAVKFCGLEFFWDQGGGRVEILFMPHCEIFLINVEKKGSFQKKQLNLGKINMSSKVGGWIFL